MVSALRTALIGEPSKVTICIGGADHMRRKQQQIRLIMPSITNQFQIYKAVVFKPYNQNILTSFCLLQQGLQNNISLEYVLIKIAKLLC